MTRGSFSTQRYQNFGVFIPGVTHRVVAAPSARGVLARTGSSLQANGFYTTSFTARHKGEVEVGMTAPDGTRYSMHVSVAC